ncbi:hypothetical protein SAY87_015296 [Trapa incisa]|uniref:Glutaredoxin domain-containing protein n=1 Tax=Trapa incisa TaxID=236973 RepID=A0AAN7GZ28_9MYRT|nr:hypothetical protein SAY87_015296 [Trapa incisa]
MGCVSSTLLNNDEEFSQLGSAAFGHHIVSLTSTTYGLLSMDPHPSATTPPTPPPRFTLGSIFPSPLSDPRSLRPPVKPESEPCPSRPEPEVINSWELMAGLDTSESFRFSPLPLPLPTPKFMDSSFQSKENCNPNFRNPKPGPLEKFELLCPPNGENRVVLYTTSLRGVRTTFEACNSVRSAIEGLGVAVCERDVSMHSGFREELRELMRGKPKEMLVPPRAFVRGRYIGGAEEVLRIAEEGELTGLLEGLPKGKIGVLCDGCGGVRFLPCFRCSGSCKLVILKGEEVVKQEDHDEEEEDDGGRRSSMGAVVVRCNECNENGLVLCPICS